MALALATSAASSDCAGLVTAVNKSTRADGRRRHAGNPELALHFVSKHPPVPAMGRTCAWNGEIATAEQPPSPPGARPATRLRYFGCGTIRRYGFGDFQPSGYFCFASSSVTAGRMITSSPCFQFTGVATLCLAVS